MADSCLVKFAKVILYIINILFFLIGAGIIGMGAYLLTEANTLFNPDEQAILNKTNIYVGIAFGAIVLVVAIAGMVGAKMGDKACGKVFLSIYSILIAVVILAEILAGILVLSMSGNLGTMGKNAFVQNSTQAAEQAMLKFADRMYDACCGAKSSTDWVCTGVKSLYKSQNPQKQDICVGYPGELLEFIAAIAEWLSTKVKPIGIGFIILGVVELVCMFAACHVMCQGGKSDEDKKKEQEMNKNKDGVAGNDLAYGGVAP